jgi:hypothetical protein
MKRGVCYNVLSFLKTRFFFLGHPKIVIADFITFTSLSSSASGYSYSLMMVVNEISMENNFREEKKGSLHLAEKGGCYYFHWFEYILSERSRQNY